MLTLLHRTEIFYGRASIATSEPTCFATAGFFCACNGRDQGSECAWNPDCGGGTEPKLANHAIALAVAAQKGA